MRLLYKPTYQDIHYCFRVSKFRYDVNKHLGWTTTAKELSIIDGFVGALGELAVSKMTGITWEGAMLEEIVYYEWRQQRADLGPFEVKTINSGTGKLIIKNQDKDFAMGVLVYAPKSRDVGLQLLKTNNYSGQLTAEIIGCLPVKQAKQIGQVVGQPIRYVVDQKQLLPPSTLEPIIFKLDKMRKISKKVNMKNYPPFTLV